MSNLALVSEAVGATTGTDNVSQTAAAGDLAIFVVLNNDATVTATIGATSGIAADAVADDGTRRSRIFSKVLVSGDISAGTVFMQASAHATGGSRRVMGFVMRDPDGVGFDSVLANRLVGTATNVTASGTSVTLTVGTASTNRLCGVAGTNIGSTTQQQTAAWTLDNNGAGTARTSDWPGLAANLSNFFAKPNGAGTEGAWAAASRTKEEVVITPFGASQARACALAVYKAKAVVTQRSAFRSASATGRAVTPNNLVTQRSATRAPSSSSLRSGTASRTLVGGKVVSASAARAPFKTLISVPARSAFRSVAAALGRFTPDNLRDTVKVGLRGTSSIATASPLVRSTTGFRSASASGGGRATPHVYRQRAQGRSANATVGRVTSHTVAHPSFRSTSASASRIISQTIAHPAFRSISATIARGVTLITSRPGARSASATKGRSTPITTERVRTRSPGTVSVGRGVTGSRQLTTFLREASGTRSRGATSDRLNVAARYISASAGRFAAHVLFRYRRKSRTTMTAHSTTPGAVDLSTERPTMHPNDLAPIDNPNEGHTS